MKETLSYFRQQIVEAKDIAKLRWKSFCAASILLMAVYVGSVNIEPGWATYLISTPASVLVSYIALVRLNAIGPQHMALLWDIRILGLVLAGTGAALMLCAPFLEQPSFPTWVAVTLIWGVALSWITSPGQPPFWKYWTGEWRDVAPPRPPLARVMGRVTGIHSVDDLKKREQEYKETSEDYDKDGTRRPRDEGDSK